MGEEKVSELIVKCPRCEIDVASPHLKEIWDRMIKRIAELEQEVEDHKEAGDSLIKEIHRLDKEVEKGP